MATKQNETTELTLKKETSIIAQEAQALTVSTPEEATIATALLSKANKTLDAIIAEEEKITKPANAVIKAERARWASAKSELKLVIETYRAKLGEYQTLALKAKEEADAKIAQRVGEGKGHIKVETAIAKMAENAYPEATIATDEGSLSFRSKQVLTIVNAEDIPRYYLIPNEQLLLDDLKAGQVIPGVRMDVVQIPVNKRG